MAKKTKSYKNLLSVEYNQLGTLSYNQLIQAIIDDLHMIKEDYGVQYFRNARLLVWASNEYGDPRKFVRNGGEEMRKLDSTHYRPACLDYDL